MNRTALDLIDTLDTRTRQTDALQIAISTMVAEGAADELVIQLTGMASELCVQANNATHELWNSIDNNAGADDTGAGLALTGNNQEGCCGES